MWPDVSTRVDKLGKAWGDGCVPVMLILSQQNQESVASWKTQWQGTHESTMPSASSLGPTRTLLQKPCIPQAYLGQRRGATRGVPGRLEVELHIGRPGILS